jgi:photosystem II stability/assembly factor-like uncharacterized protein
MKTLLIICCGLLLQAFSPADPVQKGKIFLSKDEGESWVRADIGLPDDAAITAWTVLSDIVVVSTENDGMYMSFDKLKSWRHVYKGLPADIKIKSLTAHKGMLFAGSHQHGVYVSKDAGDTWQRSSEGLGEGFVRALYSMNGKLFAGTNTGIYRSYSDGKLWSQVANGIQINDFASSNDILYAATNFGALRSTDGGTTWSNLVAKEGLSAIFADQNMVSSIALRENAYTWVESDGRWIKRTPEFNNGYSFRITPVSAPLLMAKWRNTFKSLREGKPFRSDGLPGDVSFSQILVTPFGVLIATGGGGC